MEEVTKLNEKIAELQQVIEARNKQIRDMEVVLNEILNRTAYLLSLVEKQ